MEQAMTDAAVVHRMTYRANPEGKTTIWLGEDEDTAVPEQVDKITDCCGRLFDDLPHEDWFTWEPDDEVSCPGPTRGA